MKQTLRNMTISALLPALMALGQTAFARDLTVPKGTDVMLVFDQSLSSKTAKAGDRVAMHVAEDIMVGGKTIIAHGTKVNGTVSSVDKRKHFGVNAKLRMTFDPVRSVKGKMIDLMPKDKGKYTGSRTDQAGMASGGGALILGPVGLVGGYFVVGKQINIKPGDRALTEVAQDTTIAMR